MTDVMDDDVEVAMELAKDATGDTVEQRVVRALRNEVTRLRGEQDIVHIKSGMYYENQWGPMTEELRRYREREPLVQELVEAVMNDPSETPFDEYACLIVRFGSCIKSGATDVASEANAAGSSGSEPTK